MGDESKLPKWAQDEMTRLRRRAADAEADRDMIVKGGDPTKCDGFWLEARLGEGGDYPIPVHNRRLSYRDNNGEIDFRRIKNQHGTWLELNGNGGDGLVVRPWVTNVIHIRIV